MKKLFEKLKAKISKILKIKFTKAEAQKTALFILTFALAYSIIYFLTKSIIPDIEIEYFVGKTILFILNFLGISGEIFFQEPVLIALSTGIKIEISYLCTGMLELIVLIAAIIASHGISWKKRAIGIFSAIIIAPIFNLLRIIITILVILNSNSIELIDLTHNILFRIILFLVIVGIYFAWFLWATNQLKTLKNISSFAGFLSKENAAEMEKSINDYGKINRKF